MAVLVCGGAGYIGSITVERLVEAGIATVVLDNLSRGHREAVHPEAAFVEGDIADRALLRRCIDEHGVDAVMHFCAHSQVGESVERPLMYYENNVGRGVALLETLVEAGVGRFIFSSTAACFGEPEAVPIDEDCPHRPTNPYGRSKSMFERILADADAAHGLRSVALRYFNACGATETRGEDHRPETHLIPIVLEVAAGRREALSVFGRDYDTPDGSCIRDYVHVADLADAHILALGALERGAPSTAYNLGNGRGFSVLEILEAAEAVVGRPIARHDAPRRPGDPARLVASSERIQRELGWQPRFTDPGAIIETAWRWHQDHPAGYGEA